MFIRVIGASILSTVLRIAFKSCTLLKDSYTEDDCWETGFHICVSSENALPHVELCFLCGSAGEGKV